ncbi:MAG TPA: hypothetical protein VGQ09_11930 [Chitinophagaceae bacterium]|jgi:hypothetical protein|nr:hypothetical protein [Chitinophagaceae bacterium]
MKKILAIAVVLFLTVPLFSQKIDSIYFHLYTDSLKKGQHNYINVDGKLLNGRWQPLTSKEIDFTASAGKFEGNDLILPTDFKGEKVKVKAVLKSNPEIWKEITIWIKRLPDPDRLPTKEEILNNSQPRKRKG